MISARIAYRRARAIQRGYLQGVPRGYKQILVPEELVGGIKLMLKGKQLHEELNAANGACTHYLAQAIWDAYRKGIISVSQRRTLLRVNKAANSAKHQSSLHGTVGNVADKQELSLAELLDGPADSRLFSLQSAAFNVLYGDFSVDVASRGISMEAPSPVAHAGWHDDLGLDVTDVTVENSLLVGSVLHEEGILLDDHRPVVTDFTVENNLDFRSELDDVRKALAEESASLLAGSFLHENGTLHDDHRPMVTDFTDENNLALDKDSLLDGSVLHGALTEDSVHDSLQVGSTLHEDETLHEALTEDSVQDSLLVGSTLRVDATLHDSASSVFARPLHEKEFYDEKVNNEACARWADVFSSDGDDDFEHELHGHFDFDGAADVDALATFGDYSACRWKLQENGLWVKSLGDSGASDTAKLAEDGGQQELTCSPDPTEDVPGGKNEVGEAAPFDDDHCPDHYGLGRELRLHPTGVAVKSDVEILDGDVNNGYEVEDSLLVGSTLHVDETLHGALTEDSVPDLLLDGSTLHEGMSLAVALTEASAPDVFDSAGCTLHEEETLHGIDNESTPINTGRKVHDDEDEAFEDDLVHSDLDVPANTGEKMVPVFIPCEVVSVSIGRATAKTLARSLLDRIFSSAASLEQGQQVGKWIELLNRYKAGIERTCASRDQWQRKYEDICKRFEDLRTSHRQEFEDWTDGFKKSYAEHLAEVQAAHLEELQSARALQTQLDSLKSLNSKLIQRLQQSKPSLACHQSSDLPPDSLHDFVLHDVSVNDFSLHDSLELANGPGSAAPSSSSRALGAKEQQTHMKKYKFKKRQGRKYESVLLTNGLTESLSAATSDMGLCLKD